MLWRHVVDMCSPFPQEVHLRLLVASFTQAEQFEDDSLSSPGQDAHTSLQLLVPPLEHGVQWPQVLDGRHIQEVVLGQPRVERLEFLWNKNMFGKEWRQWKSDLHDLIGWFGCMDPASLLQQHLVHKPRVDFCFLTLGLYPQFRINISPGTQKLARSGLKYDIILYYIII